MLTTFIKRRAARDESGAVAIIFALLAVMLMTLAALGTDIGNEVGRKTSTQNQADFAAFAAAGKMTQTGHLGDTPSAAVLSAIADSMNANQPQDDKLACWRTQTCVSTAQLTDADLTNGDVRYTADGLQVTAPNHYVSFGMARVMGFQGTYVGAQATVNIYSPGLRVLPMFAVQGCDYGLQTIADPANGHVSPVAPPLAYDTDTNDTSLVQPAQPLDSSGNPVTSLTVNSTGNMLQLAAQKWDQTTKIGFFRGDNTDPTLVQTKNVFWLMGDNTKTNLNGANGYSQNPQTTVQLNIPNAVAQVQSVWWIRVFDQYNNQWSPRSQAVPLVVGNAVLQCGAGSLDGNFGTLRLLRNDVPTADDLPMNIATGLQPPLSLTVHQQWASDSPTGECVDGQNGAVVTSVGTNLKPNTNCVDTDTGLAANVATQGLITGVDGQPGLLTTAGTKSGCSPNGGSNSQNISVQNTNYTIDNNVLTCYLTDGTTSLQTICDPNYNGGPALDKSIVADPRFVWVPVLKVKPDSGGSNTWSIIDVRPGFITDETVTNSTIKGTKTASANNGVVVDNNGVTQLNVVFFNINAMPRDDNGNKIDYLGVGPPLIRLIK
jgi:Flp pilus assembly protein TadG